MGLYGFKPQFKPKILSGEKRHTIRAPRKIEDKPGNTFYGYVGLRQPGEEKIIEAPYVKGEPIIIEPSAHLIEISGVRLSSDEMEAFARADGFEGWLQMRLFWRDANVFAGVLHHWDFDRREPC